MSKENAIRKINKYGKIGRIITIVMTVCVSLAIISTLIASIVMYKLPENIVSIDIGTQAEMILNPKAIDPNFDESQLEIMNKAFDSGSAGLNLGVIRLKFHNADIEGDKLVARTNEAVGTLSLHDIGNALLVAVLSLILTFISLIFACRLCKAVERCDSPFENAVIKDMRCFAWSLLPWAVFSSVLESAISSIFGNNIEIGISLNMNIIFTVFVIFALTIVFKYGAILQLESDETL